MPTLTFLPPFQANWRYMLNRIRHYAGRSAYWRQVEMMLYQLSGLDDAYHRLRSGRAIDNVPARIKNKPPFML